MSTMKIYIFDTLAFTCFQQLESKCFNRIAAKLINYWKFSLTFFYIYARTQTHTVTVSNGSVCFAIIVLVVAVVVVGIVWRCDLCCHISYPLFMAYKIPTVKRCFGTSCPPPPASVLINSFCLSTMIKRGRSSERR